MSSLLKTQEFWDQRFSLDPIGEIKKLEVEGEHDPILTEALNFFGDVKGKRLIDLGAGGGKATLFFARRGAFVSAIDTSKVAIQNLKMHCEDRRISNVTPLEMSVWNIQTLGPTDLVFGSMILHHLEPFESFAALLRNTMGQAGKACFIENNSSNPILLWFRTNFVGKFGIPKYSDEEESPLTPREIQILKKYFEVKIWYPEFLFFRLIPIYIFRDHFFSPFKFLDALCYKIPFLRRFSYLQCLFLVPK